MFHPCNYIVPVITPPVFLLSPQWVRRLVAGLSVRRPGFDPRPLGFVVDRVALDRFFAKYLYFSLSVSFHQSCTLPCQYHFTKAALSPVSIIPPKLHSPLSVSFHQSCTLPCQYHFTKAPYSFSSAYCSYQKDERAKPGNISKHNALSEIGELWIRGTVT